MKPSYRMIWIMALIGIFITSGCSNDKEESGSGSGRSLFRSDNIPPVPGKKITLTQKTPQNIVVTWDASSDYETLQKNLQYKLVYSARNNIGTVDSAERNGTVVMGWTPGTLSRQVKGLPSTGAYYFTVLVRDEAGNMAVYVPQSLSAQESNLSVANMSMRDEAGNKTVFTPRKSSAHDTNTPQVVSGLVVSDITFDGATVSWEPADDDVTPPDRLQYKVIYSTNRDMDNVKDAENNGQSAMEWTANITSHRISGLEPSTTYYIATLVRDEAGNTAIYEPREVTTTSQSGKGSGE
ncbi:MAG TPA: fibronectin type III domain-containing protein [Desulfomonilia bacterium]